MLRLSQSTLQVDGKLRLIEGLVNEGRRGGDGGGGGVQRRLPSFRLAIPPISLLC